MTQKKVVPTTEGLRTAKEIAVTAEGPRELPALRKTRQGRAPTTATVVGDNGLSIFAVRRASSPLVELRLRIPFGGRNEIHAARAELLAETIMAGTSTRSREQIDVELALVGGQLDAHVTPQRLLLSGSVLASGYDVLLEILADVLTNAAFKRADVDRECERLVEHLLIGAAQPAVIARNALLQLRFGSHPAAWEIPDHEIVADVSAAAVRGLYRRAVMPAGSNLVIVGDVSPKAAADRAAAALSVWTGDHPAQLLAPPPPQPSANAIIAHHRAEAVQSMTRLSGTGVLRSDQRYPAFQLANIVFGGYFSSRLVENLREDKGYTYHAYSQLEFWPEHSAITIGYDTATDVTAAALLETRYELGRMVVDAIPDDEIEAARNYAIGVLAAALSTQAGYASMCSTLIGNGLDHAWLRAHSRAVAAVPINDVIEAGRSIFAPAAMTGIVVGDMDVIGESLQRLGNVELAQ